MRAAQLLGNRRVAAPLQIFLLCVAVLLPITVFSVFALTQYAASESKRVFDSALDSARQLNHALEQDLQGRISGLRVLSLSRALAAGDYQAFYVQSERARAILGAEIQYSNAVGELVTDTARPLAAPTPVGLGEDQQRALTDGVVISQLLGEPGNWYVRISVPVSGSGATSGVLSMYLSPGQLGQVLRQAALPEEWTLAAVGNDGRIIARSRDEARFVGAPASTDLQRNAVGLEGSWHGTTADGQPVLSAYVQSSLADWRVAVGVPTAVVDGPFWSSVFWLLAIGVLGLVISIAVALFFGVELARAMGSLGELAKDPANADQRPLPYTSIKEVHAVALALSEGAKRLRLEAEARDEAEQTSKDSRERLERIVQTSPVGIIEVAEGAIHFANSTAQRLLQLRLRENGIYEVPNWHRRTLAGEPLSLDTDPTVRALRGQTVKEQELVLHDPGGEGSVALSVNAVPIEDGGKIVGAVSSFVDISERVGAERELQEHSDHLKTLNDTGAAIAAELELEALVQMVTDAGVELIDAEFGAFFYNTYNERGEILTLYTISGVPREHFSKFPMPRNTKVFSPTFNGDGIIRSGDITQDPRYGHNDPHHGMPEGHLPVRSYLAVPVASRTGEVIGGLFFGHSAADRFSAQHEALIAGVAGQAAVGIDNARLYEEATRARASLTELNRSLEERITARTAELVASNRQLLEEKEQRELVEDQLRQAQKMEALGQLTGGIAHDFNNLLAIIVGSLDVLRRRVDRGQFNDMTRFLDNAMEGAKRATSLTQRLLAYARRQPLAPEVIDPKSLVVDVSELLRRTIPETIRIETVISAGLWLTHADKSELENAIVNLAVNARDAMPDGGQLTLEASNADIDDRYAGDHPGVSTGQYVLIAVTDTGSGMTKEVADRAFDPFFTTKETGKGTGLGLSQLYGYVRQTGGHVKIYSELGAGTTVKMYLPRYTGAEVALKGPASRATLPTGTEVVLLVEDEEGVRLASAEALRELGYKVHLAADAAEALSFLETNEQVNLLFTDVVMPGMNGRQLADAALLRHPQLRVLFTSGYTRNAIVHNGVLDAGVNLLVKPFTLADLAHKLRSVLDAGRQPL